MDKERINDIETLDTSFLEGRISNKKNRAVKEKLLNNKENKFLKYMKYFFIFLAVVLVIVGIYLFVRGIRKQLDKIDSKSEQKEVDVVPTPTMNIDMDNNYLFIGTFNTERLNFEDDYHYIKISDDKFETDIILEDMVGQVYQYNPTYVFIELGINELDIESNKEFVDNLGKIIDGIKDNRPYAEIYVESIYPINKEVENYDNSIIKDFINNELIYTVNKDIKKMVEEKEVKYLDLYSLLIEDGNLIKDYTDNGVYLNERGNKVVYDEVNKIVG